jgi:DNA repair exonuclease SbcCD ATPase subunit
MSNDDNVRLKTPMVGLDEGFLIVGDSDFMYSKADVAVVGLANQDFQMLDTATPSTPPIKYEDLVVQTQNILEQKDNLIKELVEKENLIHEIESLKSKLEHENNLTISQLKMELKKSSLEIGQLSQKCVYQEKHINELGLISQLDAQKVKDTLIELEVTKAKVENDKKEAVLANASEVENVRSELKVELNKILTESETKLANYEAEIRSQAIRSQKPDERVEKLTKDLHEVQMQNLQLREDLKRATLKKPLPSPPTVSPTAQLIVNEQLASLSRLCSLDKETNRAFEGELLPVIETYFGKMEAIKKELKNCQENLHEVTTNSEYLQLQVDDYKQRHESLKNDNETLNEIIAMLKADAN